MSRVIAISLILWVFLLTTFDVCAQECIHTNLSDQFDYKIKLVRKRDSDNIYRTGKIALMIYNKRKILIQKISFEPPFLYEGAYKSCNSVRSYRTGINKDAEVADYDFGDFIVADLNFDGKEDFAIKYDSGGNGGPIYNFYMQDNSGHFRLDHFLTDSMGSFPKYINSKHRTLTTQIHANVSQEGKKTFKLNPKTQKWKLIKWIMVDD